MSFKVTNLTVVKNKHVILQKINISFPKKGICFVVGRNGAGKSTLLRSLVGVEKFSGDVYLAKDKIKEIPVQERGKKICWLDSSHNIEWDYQVIDVVLLGLFPWHQGMICNADYDKCFSILKKMNILELKNRCLSSLSSGQKQLVMLARSLVGEQQVVVMDEPTINLDADKTIDFFKQIKISSQTKLFIISTHEYLFATLFADHLSVVKAGKVDKVYKNPCEKNFNEMFVELGVPFNFSSRNCSFLLQQSRENF
jgi:ABC-type cobalamin/Fe3+-siderophores transport system ATPase subunit